MAQHLTLIHVEITIAWIKLIAKEKLISLQERFELKSTIQTESTITCHHRNNIQQTGRQKEEDLLKTPKIILINPNLIAIKTFCLKSKSSNKSVQVRQWTLALNYATKEKNLGVQSHKASISVLKTSPSPKDKLISTIMFTVQMWPRSRSSNGRLKMIHYDGMQRGLVVQRIDIVSQTQHQFS